MHWHIDYLLKSPDCHIRDILFNISEERIECDLAESISKDGEEIPGFGCSDCSCSSHLIYFKRKRDALASTRNAYDKIKNKKKLLCEKAHNINHNLFSTS